MSLYSTLVQKVTDLTNAFNAQTQNAKSTDELPTATLPLNSADLLRVQQGGVSRKVEYSETGGIGTVQKVYAAVAGASQSSFTVPENVISDNGLWILVVGGANFLATNGVASTPSGAVSINFVTGVVTFNNSPNQGTSINFKYY